MKFSPTVLGISFAIAYVIQFILWILMIPNSVFRIDDANHTAFFPQVPLLTLYKSFQHTFYWYNPKFMLLNFYYSWLISYFGLAAVYKEGMHNKNKTY